MLGNIICLNWGIHLCHLHHSVGLQPPSPPRMCHARIGWQEKKKWTKGIRTRKEKEKKRKGKGTSRMQPIALFRGSCEKLGILLATHTLEL